MWEIFTPIISFLSCFPTRSHMHAPPTHTYTHHIHRCMSVLVYTLNKYQEKIKHSYFSKSRWKTTKRILKVYLKLVCQFHQLNWYWKKMPSNFQDEQNLNDNTSNKIRIVVKCKHWFIGLKILHNCQLSH